jgi:hypothetical protein
MLNVLGQINLQYNTIQYNTIQYKPIDDTFKPVVGTTSEKRGHTSVQRPRF